MGTFHVEIEVGDPEDRRYDRVEVLVDTGATYASLPCPLIEARERFVLADGREVERDIGRAWVPVGGRTEVTLVVFADPGSPMLLGAYALEGLRLAADRFARRLVPVPGLLLKC